MAKKFKDLRKAMSPEAQARAHEKAMVMNAQLPLAELRQARYFSQEQLAAVLEVKQPVLQNLKRKQTCIIRACVGLLKQWVGS